MNELNSEIDSLNFQTKEPDLKLEIGKCYLDKANKIVVIQTCELIGFNKDRSFFIYEGFTIAFSNDDDKEGTTTYYHYTQSGKGISNFYKWEGHVNPVDLVEEIID